jgi:ABC-type transport system involved in cytochrome bd biosynthesis fused ATPase/permease subunit
VGASGGGKSSVVKLLLRLYDPQSGSVLLDGVDLRAYNVQALRGLQALVSQEPQLFGRSMRDNIRLGREAAVRRRVRACTHPAPAAARLRRRRATAPPLRSGSSQRQRQGGASYRESARAEATRNRACIE